MESRVNSGRTEAVACNVILPAGARLHSHLVTSSTPSPLFAVYAEALAWLRQLHAMCAGADAPFPLPLPPLPTASSSPEPACYVTKMAAGARPMQPFDPRRWDSCPSPSPAPCVDPPGGGHVTGHVGGGRGARDFSIPSILSGGAGSSSTGADSDATSESGERCQSSSSSLDDACDVVVTSRRHVVTSHDSVQRAPAQLMSHQRRRQQDRQQFECPQCNKVPALLTRSVFVALND